MGRGIRRLISLFASLEAIINEADNRLQAEADGRESPEPTNDEEVEAHEAWVPSLWWMYYIISTRNWPFT